MENDNIKLLRECDAGVEMGMSSIDDVLPYVKAENLKNGVGTAMWQWQGTIF